MSKHHIYVSGNYNAEDVTDFYIESDEPITDIIKAVALEALQKRFIDAEEIESITFHNNVKVNNMAVIQLNDYHICVWEGEEKIQTKTIDKKYLDLAKNLEDDLYLDVEDDAAEIQKLFDKLEEMSEHEDSKLERD